MSLTGTHSGESEASHFVNTPASEFSSWARMSWAPAPKSAPRLATRAADKTAANSAFFMTFSFLSIRADGLFGRAPLALAERRCYWDCDCFGSLPAGEPDAFSASGLGA